MIPMQSSPSVTSTDERTAQRTPAGLCAVYTLVFAAAMLSGPGLLHAQTARPVMIDSLRISEVLFEGVASIEQQTLDDLLETRESPAAFWTFLHSISERFPLAEEPRYFDYDIFARDVDALTRHYRNNGFFSARIDGRYVIDSSAREISVRFLVEEGPASFVDSVQYRLAGTLPPDVSAQIFAAPLLLAGRRYRAQDLAAERDRVLDILRNAGFPRAYSDSIIVERKLSNNNLLVRMPFMFGTQLRVGTIGDSIINPPLNLARRIIHDRLDFRAGDIYSVRARDRAEANLNRLGIFSTVQVQADIPAIDDTTRRTVPITIVLAEKLRHELAPALLVNNQFSRLNAGAEIAYLFRNVFGGAQTFTARIDGLFRMPRPVEGFQISAQARLDQPYFIDNDNSAYISTAYILARERGVYGGDLQQNVIGVRRRFTERVQGHVDWTIEQTNYSDIGKPPANSAFAMFDTTGINYRNSIIAVGFERDQTNDFFNPTDGLYLRGLVEEAGVLRNTFPGLFASRQSTEYVKTEGMVKYFRDLSRNRTSILGVKLMSGLIFRYGQSLSDNIPVPFNRRYYAGGSTSVRGWGSRKLSIDGEQAAGFGNNAIAEASIEYRWQLFPEWKQWLALEPNKIWLVLFADAGNIWDTPASLRLSEAALAFGFGIRYLTFFGPIRLDYGMRAYDPTIASQKWFTERSFVREILAKGAIHFGIGHAF